MSIGQWMSMYKSYNFIHTLEHVGTLPYLPFHKNVTGTLGIFQSQNKIHNHNPGYYSLGVLYINYFNPHNSPTCVTVIIIPIFKGRNRDTAMLSTLSKFIQLISVIARI